MIHALYRTADGKLHTDLPPERFAAALRKSGSLLWVDMDEESAERCEPILCDIFGFHPLAVDDALQESHVPKVDDWSSYLYLVLHGALLDQRKGIQLDTLELDVFLGKNYVVTHHIEPIAAVDRVWAACQRDARYMEKGAGRLLYRLVDELVADYMPVVEDFDLTIDEIEDRVFDRPDPTLVERIFQLKRALLHLRRIIAPQREVLNKLARGDYSVLDPDDRVFFRDIYDHLVRLYDITESLRDLVSGALDTYLSVINNRMNEVMKTLTIITTMFMPIAFVAGFFGMNFFPPVPGLEAWMSIPVFVLTLLVILIAPTSMFLWMRKRAWM